MTRCQDTIGMGVTLGVTLLLGQVLFADELGSHEAKMHSTSTCSCESVGRASRIRAEFLEPTSEYVLVVAHRGDWRNAPENSLQAIENCINMGVDVVEIDVRRTLDENFVLMHDSTLDRTTTGQGPVEEHTLEELRLLRLRNGQGRPTRHSIPTLHEALHLAKGSILLNLDKCENYLSEVNAIVSETGMKKQVILKSKEPFQSLDPAFVGSLEDTIFMPVINLDLEDASEHLREYEKHMKPYAYELVFQHSESLDRKLVNKLRARGARIWVNTLWPKLCAGHEDDRAVDDPDGSYGWVLDTRASIIQTDRPALLIEYLKKAGRRNRLDPSRVATVPE